MFAIDNKDALPTQDDRYAPSLFKYRTNFVTLLKEYTSSFKVWNCPTYGDIPAIDESVNSRGMSYITYSYFPGRRQADFGQGIPNAKSFLDENATAQNVFLQDNIRDHSTSHGLGVWTNHSPVTPTSGSANPSGTTRRVPSMSQMYGVNILFYDGHAKWVHQKALQDVGPDTPGSGVRIWSVLPN